MLFTQTVEQRFPQAPQFMGSVVVSVHPAAHSVNVPSQVLVPVPVPVEVAPASVEVDVLLDVDVVTPVPVPVPVPVDPSRKTGPPPPVSKLMTRPPSFVGLTTPSVPPSSSPAPTFAPWAHPARTRIDRT